MIKVVATVTIQEMNGTTPSYTGLTSARYCTTDSPTPGTANSIPIPAAGFNWSFWKSHVLDMTGAFTRIDNIRWYTDGAVGWNFGTSGHLYVGYRINQPDGDIGAPTSNAYYQASGTVGTTGIPMYSGHTFYQNISARLILASCAIAASPFIIDSTAYESAGKSKAIVTQAVVDDDATQGTQTAETVTFRYDEV